MLTYCDDHADALHEPDVGYEHSALFYYRLAPCRNCGERVYSPRRVVSDTVAGFVCSGCRAKYTQPLEPSPKKRNHQLIIPGFEPTCTQ